MKNRNMVVFALLFALVCRATSAQNEATLARPGEALLGPFQIDQTVEGVPLSIRTYAFLSVTKADDPVEVSVRILADLSDLQTKVETLVDRFPLPTDNCAEFDVDNLVAKIWGKQITISGDVATLKLNGDVDVWTCAKNPIPCTRLDGWELVFYDCNPPIKNRNLRQPFEATLPFRLRLVDPSTFAVELGDPKVNLGGPLGGVTGGILRIAGIDINAHARQALTSAINPDLLKQSLPKELSSFRPVFTKAELRSESGALAATLEMSATIDDAALEGLGKLLANTAGPAVR